jgi:hypothetical protein
MDGRYRYTPQRETPAPPIPTWVRLDYVRGMLQQLKSPSNIPRVCNLTGRHRVGQICHGDDLQQAPCNPKYTLPHNRQVVLRYAVDRGIDNSTVTGGTHTVDIQMRASP